ncbi:hypothetical protein N7G274_000691 [Stereocaulon virgatum]|uniref:Uncharacterized protein n=1 Tax=Stereocaulon virgatum TaxID=373712 RepID=A0ABR4AQ52_9LECA
MYTPPSPATVYLKNSDSPKPAMAESSQTPAPSKEPERPLQQLPNEQESSDAEEPETPTKHHSSQVESSDQDVYEGLSQQSSPELQLNLKYFEGEEVPESPIRGRESGSRDDTMDALGNKRQSEWTSSPSPSPVVTSNPYRLVNAQLTEPTMKFLGAGVDPFGASMVRDNERWLGRNRLVELVGRVSELEVEVARMRPEVGGSLRSSGMDVR